MLAEELLEAFLNFFLPSLLRHLVRQVSSLPTVLDGFGANQSIRPDTSDRVRCPSDHLPTVSEAAKGGVSFEKSRVADLDAIVVCFLSLTPTGV